MKHPTKQNIPLRALDWVTFYGKAEHDQNDLFAERTRTSPAPTRRNKSWIQQCNEHKADFTVLIRASLCISKWLTVFFMATKR